MKSQGRRHIISKTPYTAKRDGFGLCLLVCPQLYCIKDFILNCPTSFTRFYKLKVCLHLFPKQATLLPETTTLFPKLAILFLYQAILFPKQATLFLFRAPLLPETATLSPETCYFVSASGDFVSENKIACFGNKCGTVWTGL